MVVPANPHAEHILVPEKKKKGGEVTRPLQPAWLIKTEQQAVHQ